MSNCRDSQFLDYALETTINNNSELNDYIRGLNKGQLLLVATMRRLIASKATLESMSVTLDVIEKQLRDYNES